MKPSPFVYHRPTTLDEAVETLASVGETGKVLAGGQSLVPLMSMRLAAPADLVDINHVAGLDALEVADGPVRVGATVRHRDLELHEPAHTVVPLLRQGLVHVAHPTIRNRGTTVGSLVHADPAAEMPAVLMLLDGSVELRSVRGARSVPAAEFFVGPMESAAAADELAVAATFRRPPRGSGSAFRELARRHGDYAMCGVGAVVTTDPDGAVTRARVGLVSVGPVPVLLDLTAAVTGSGGGFSYPAVRDILDAGIEPDEDIHATAEYRRHLAHVLTLRALTDAREAAVASRRDERAA
ncbi:MAG TPA: FAD binding domain-containing protein [Nocardioidaceae bacterium]